LPIWRFFGINALKNLVHDKALANTSMAVIYEIEPLCISKRFHRGMVKGVYTKLNSFINHAYAFEFIRMSMVVRAILLTDQDDCDERPVFPKYSM